VLVLPLTTNQNREGIAISDKDLKQGSLKKESVIIVPKITAIDSGLISQSRKIATLKDKTFSRVIKEICRKFEC
jgi:hypothetical protein